MPYDVLTKKGSPEAGYPKIIIAGIVIPDKDITLTATQLDITDLGLGRDRTHRMAVASNHGYYELGVREDTD